MQLFPQKTAKSTIFQLPCGYLIETNSQRIQTTRVPTKRRFYIQEVYVYGIGNSSTQSSLLKIVFCSTDRRTEVEHALLRRVVKTKTRPHTKWNLKHLHEVYLRLRGRVALSKYEVIPDAVTLHFTLERIPFLPPSIYLSISLPLSFPRGTLITRDIDFENRIWMSINRRCIYVYKIFYIYIFKITHYFERVIS